MGILVIGPRIDDLRRAWGARDDAAVRSLLLGVTLSALGAAAPSNGLSDTGPMAPSAPSAAQPTSPPAGIAAWVAGPAYDDDSSLPAHADDVVDYVLHATLDPLAHTVHGEGTITWRNLSAAPVRDLWLHLYLNAFKNERSTFFRERVGGRGSAAAEDWGSIDVHKLVVHARDTTPVDVWPGAELHRPGDDDETDARVKLPRLIAPGETITLDVTFDDKLPIVIERTGYRGSFHMVGQWFPKVARLEPDGTWAHFPFHHLAEFYADFGSYDVTLDVPEGFTIGATGPAVERHVGNGRLVERHVQGDIHDFAWTAWDKWRTMRETIDGVDVTLLYPPGFTQVAARELAVMRFVLPYDSARYGRYPYGVLTLVHPQEDVAEAGGMEYPTLITTGSAWWDPPGLLLPEEVTVHEFGHQWFYGLLGSNELAWPFLDEGLNQFEEQDAMGKWAGPGSFLDLFGLTVSDAALAGFAGSLAASDEPVAQAANAFSNGRNYGSLVYMRTAAIFETLKRVYGDDVLRRALGRYARRFRFQHPGPEDLLAVMNEVMGAHVTATLRTALFGKGWVDYVVDSASSESAKRSAGLFDREGKREKVEPGDSDGGGFDNSVLVRRRGTLSFPVDVVMTMSDGTARLERWDGEGESKRFSWHDALALRAAVVDPEDRVLVDANLENNRAEVDGGGGGAPRTFERVLYFMQLALQAVSP
jgi:hypothetical protein